MAWSLKTPEANILLTPGLLISKVQQFLCGSPPYLDYTPISSGNESICWVYRVIDFQSELTIEVVTVCHWEINEYSYVLVSVKWRLLYFCSLIALGLREIFSFKPNKTGPWFCPANHKTGWLLLYMALRTYVLLLFFCQQDNYTVL